MHTLKEGAVLVADVHYAQYREEFLKLLMAIKQGKIVTNQLILMGDIFDALVGYSEYLVHYNRKAIQLLNELSCELEIIYLEGNHDFLLHTVFENIHVIPIQNQPLMCTMHDKHIALAHGDLNQGVAYTLLTWVLRNYFFVRVTNFLDKISNNYIYRTLLAHLKTKQICKPFALFEKEHKCVLNRRNITCDFFVEGHFHQGVQWQEKAMHYHNIDAFACNKSYFTVQFINDEVVVQKHKLREIS